MRSISSNCLSDETANTTDLRPAAGNDSARVWTRASTEGTLCALSSTTIGSRATTSIRAGHSTVASPSRTAESGMAQPAPDVCEITVPASEVQKPEGRADFEEGEPRQAVRFQRAGRGRHFLRQYGKVLPRNRHAVDLNAFFDVREVRGREEPDAMPR